jgi:hypothetical protein
MLNRFATKNPISQQLPTAAICSTSYPQSHPQAALSQPTSLSHKKVKSGEHWFCF